MICLRLFVFLVFYHLASSKLVSLDNYESQPHFIHLTKTNLEAALDRIQFRSLDVLRPKRPFTFFVEGIVGTGKSTLLKAFQKYPFMNIIPEPVDLWTNVSGTGVNILQLVGDDAQRWSMTQQSYIQLTMIDELVMPGSGLLKGLERSVHSARFCFVESFFRSGKMTKLEYVLLDSWYKLINENIDFDLDADLIIYLRADPEVVYPRIVKRARKGEEKISLDFLESLTELHEDWLIHRNSTATNSRVPASQLLVIDASSDFETMTVIYEKLAKKMCQLIPKELNANCNIN